MEWPALPQTKIIQRPEGVFIAEQGQAVIHVNAEQVRHFPQPIEKGAFMDMQFPGSGQGIPVLCKVDPECPGVFRVVGAVISGHLRNDRVDGGGQKPGILILAEAMLQIILFIIDEMPVF